MNVLHWKSNLTNERRMIFTMLMIYGFLRPSIMVFTTTTVFHHHVNTTTLPLAIGIVCTGGNRGQSEKEYKKEKECREKEFVVKCGGDHDPPRQQATTEGGDNVYGRCSWPRRPRRASCVLIIPKDLKSKTFFKLRLNNKNVTPEI